jgi:hypothetical protein
MNEAVIYANASIFDYEREGYSIAAQLKAAWDYAKAHKLTVVRQFVDVQKAQTIDRPKFHQMIGFLKKSPSCGAVVVEEIARLYGDFSDTTTLNDLDIEIHSPKDRQIIATGPLSKANLAHKSELDHERLERQRLLPNLCGPQLVGAKAPIDSLGNIDFHNIQRQLELDFLANDMTTCRQIAQAMSPDRKLGPQKIVLQSSRETLQSKLAT